MMTSRVRSAYDLLSRVFDQTYAKLNEITDPRQDKYQCLPTTKGHRQRIGDHLQATFVVDPIARLECVRLRVDFRISGDGPEAITLNPSYLQVYDSLP